jgi:hypothetical protein
MAVSFTALDRQLTRDIRELHDFLWNPAWTGNESKLQANLVRGATSLDSFLHAGGRIRKNAIALSKPWSREHQGASLFELLDDALGLTAATELLRKGKFREAVQRVGAVVESTSIGVCSAAGHFEIVEEWEARKIDFETYSGKLSTVLESRMIPQAGLFRRALNTVHDFGAEWDGSASTDEQRLAARSSIDNGAWCVSRSLTVRTLLGDPSKVSENDFGFILGRIVERI